MMLYDPDATTFLAQREAFIACFTDDRDSPTQWARPGCADGAALIFEGKRTSVLLRLSERGGTGLVGVTYD
jgi:hypothetical protein